MSDVYVVSVETKEKTKVTADKMDVEFPETVRGWGDVLDCRHTPYTKLDLDALLHRAHEVHKHFVLVSGDQLD